MSRVTMSRWIAGGLLSIAVLVVFGNCLGNTFVWDDEQFVLKNQFLASWRFLPQLLTRNVVAGAGVVSNLYRPVQSLTHFLDLRVWGPHPWGHHLSNLLFHIAAAATLWGVLGRLFPLVPATVAAGLFCLHPLQSEAVAYVSGRGDTLGILFLCLGLLTHRRHVWLALSFAGLAMLSKESLVLFPVFLALYDRMTAQPITWKQHWPFWLLSAAYVLARLTVLNFQNTLNFYASPNLLTEHLDVRITTYLTTLPKGLALWCWPIDLHHERSWPVSVGLGVPGGWLSLVGVAALGGWAWSARRTWPKTACGFAWFVLATLPTSNLVVLINAIFYDHWFLLPGIGLAVAVGELLSKITAIGGAPRTAAVSVSAVALIGFSLSTIGYNQVWKNPLSLNRHIFQWEPRSAKIANNLGMAYADQGRHPEAITLYRKALALSHDEYPQIHHNLANAYLVQGDREQALQEFRRAVEIDPRFYQAHQQIGVLHLQSGHWDEAAGAFQRARQAFPYAAQAYLGLAQVFLEQREPGKAVDILREGLRWIPGDPALTTAIRQIEPASP